MPPRLPSARRCDPAAAAEGEVIVCGRTGESPYRLKRLPERYSSTPAALPKAQVNAFGGTVSAEGEQGSDAQGGAINRAMVRLKIPLGGGTR